MARYESMEGKVCLITGGSSGVGKAAARGLARLGATVVLLARSPEGLQRSRGEILGIAPEASVETLPADLSNPESVRQAAAEVLRRHPAVHVLVEAAGAAHAGRRVTGRGWELTLATEVVGHFLLTGLLLEGLKAGAPSRVLVAVGNALPLYLARIHFDDIHLEKGYNWVRAKLQAALAKALYTFELARRLQGSGVTANAFHPGLVRSGMTRHLPWFIRVPAALGMWLLPLESPTAVRLAASRGLEGVSGGLFVGRRNVSFRPRRYDAREAARRLWELAEELTGWTMG